MKAAELWAKPEERLEVMEILKRDGYVANYETQQKKKLEENSEIDLSFSIKGLSRFRANIFMQRGTVAGAFRAIPFDIKSFEELCLPEALTELVKKPQGLILITGPAGSGKSTTMAAIIDRINAEREAHVVTVEDPIEFLHHHKKCLITQREVCSDTASMSSALKNIMRQDPDIVFIGRMQDIDTIEAAITLAETGHLILATLSTNSAVQALNRIILSFSPHQQEQVRTRLSSVIEGVLSQRLVPRIDGNGRVPAFEILLVTPAVRSLLREGKFQQIFSLMQAGQGRSGTQTLNQAVYDLYSKGLISSEDAVNYSPFPHEMLQLVAKGPSSCNQKTEDRKLRTEDRRQKEK
ncbi:MAG: PilT/PilU family type 4a pilus ATPase [Nitrospirae bacterium]|nr:PilT/PilU family type 4a pilus ATPase [Nitrospirota bacterium]